MITTIKTVLVTVKIANPVAELNGIQSLMKEVKVMMYLENYENIAHMIGCFIKNLLRQFFETTAGKLLLPIEFCSAGTLETFLNG